MRRLVIAILFCAFQSAQAVPVSAEVGAQDYDKIIATFDRACFGPEATSRSTGATQSDWNKLPASVRFLRDFGGSQSIRKTEEGDARFIVESVLDQGGDRSCAVVVEGKGGDEFVAALAKHFDAQASSFPLKVGEAMLSSITRDDLLVNIATTSDGYLVIRRLQMAQPALPPVSPAIPRKS